MKGFLFLIPLLSTLHGAPLLHEPFSTQSAGNLPGQATSGAGFAAASIWTGFNSSLSASVADASTLQAGAGLGWEGLVGNANLIRVKGDASNTRAMMDVSSTGTFALAGLRDAASNTIGGGGVQGMLYLSFLFRAVSTDRTLEFGGLQLARANSFQTGTLIGNGWDQWAYSIFVAPSTYIDLKENGGTGPFKNMDNLTRLIVARIEYKANAADTITVWMDPDLLSSENDQNLSGVYMGSGDGDFSFDQVLLRGGNATRPFEYDEIRMGTAWADVIPVPSPPLVLENDNLKATIRADGSLDRLQANRRGVWEDIPHRRDSHRGPAWQVTTGGSSTEIPLTRDSGTPSFTGNLDGRVFKLVYQLDATALRVTARVENPGTSVWSPDRASIRLGIDSYMATYPEWNNRYFPTLLRCEKSHFWGYFMSPLGGIAGYTVSDPVASWHHDYEYGQHRIYTSYLDLLQSGPLPARHPQNSNNIAAGAAREWKISLMDLPVLDDAPASLAALADAPVIQADRYQGDPGQAVTLTIHGPISSLTANGVPLAFSSSGASKSTATWTLPAALGSSTVVATNAAGEISECLLVTRRPWSWYLQRARAEAIAKPQKGSSHCESWYGLYSGYLAQKHFPNPSEDTAIEAKFAEIFPLMYTTNTNGTTIALPTPWGDRIQNHSSMAGVLVDRYQASGNIRSLEQAADLCDYLMSRQGADGAYRAGSHHYTSVIYIAKSIMEVMAEEKKLVDAGNPAWLTRYNNHYDSVKRAMDDLVNLGGNLGTEGQATFEDGMIACSYAQLAQFALLQTDPTQRAKYTNAAVALASWHRCLSQKLIPDGRMNGGSLRFWEAQYDVLAQAANMMNSPHGWSAWRLYGLRSLYELTGDPAYLRDAMNGLGSCVQTINPTTGDLRWSFIVDPSLSVGVFSESPSSPGVGQYVQTTIGEDYLPMISGWYRAPANTWVGGHWGGNGGCTDNDVHEIFKCVEEIALTSSYLILGPNHSTEVWNGTLETIDGTLVITPAESVVSRVHVNRQPGDTRAVAVRFGQQLVYAPANGSAWVEPGNGISAYDAWRASFFGADYATQSDAADNADPDADAINNRLEFLIGGRDPKVFERSPQLVALDGVDKGWLEFSVPRNPAALPDRVNIRISDELTAWRPVAPGPAIAIIEDSPTRHAVKVLPPGPPLFLRAERE
ncbi:MAG: hypothetical protein ACRDBP_10925 [Luteolibacter sp.]